MKRTFFLVSFIIGLLSFNSKASNSDLFQYDENVIIEKFQSLNNLELFINQNQGITLTEIQANSENDGLVANLDKSGINCSFSILAGAPLGIPSFLWGCCFGAVGVLIVYLTADDPEETKKSVYGCITGAVISGVFYAISFSMSAATP